jgi:hypothetical protein
MFSFSIRLPLRSIMKLCRREKKVLEGIGSGYKSSSRLARATVPAGSSGSPMQVFAGAA